MLAYFLLCQAQFKPWQVGGVGEIEIKTKLSPAEAGVWAELGKKRAIVGGENQQEEKKGVEESTPES